MGILTTAYGILFFFALLQHAVVHADTKERTVREIAEAAIQVVDGRSYSSTFSYCPPEIVTSLQYLTWPRTRPGDRACVQGCPRGQTGQVCRICNENGAWGEVNFSKCEGGMVAEVTHVTWPPPGPTSKSPRAGVKGTPVGYASRVPPVVDTTGPPAGHASTSPPAVRTGAPAGPTSGGLPPAEVTGPPAGPASTSLSGKVTRPPAGAASTSPSAKVTRPPAGPASTSPSAKVTRPPAGPASTSPSAEVTRPPAGPASTSPSDHVTGSPAGHASKSLYAEVPGPPAGHASRFTPAEVTRPPAGPTSTSPSAKVTRPPTPAGTASTSPPAKVTRPPAGHASTSPPAKVTGSATGHTSTSPSAKLTAGQESVCLRPSCDAEAGAYFLKTGNVYVYRCATGGYQLRYCHKVVFHPGPAEKAAICPAARLGAFVCNCINKDDKDVQKVRCPTTELVPAAYGGSCRFFGCPAGLVGWAKAFCAQNSQWQYSYEFCVPPASGVSQLTNSDYVCQANGVWPKTKVQNIACVPCSGGRSGWMCRTCSEHGAWGETNFGGCRKAKGTGVTPAKSASTSPPAEVTGSKVESASTSPSPVPAAVVAAGQPNVCLRPSCDAEAGAYLWKTGNVYGYSCATGGYQLRYCHTVVFHSGPADKEQQYHFVAAICPAAQLGAFMCNCINKDNKNVQKVRCPATALVPPSYGGACRFFGCPAGLVGRAKAFCAQNSEWQYSYEFCVPPASGVSQLTNSDYVCQASGVWPKTKVQHIACVPCSGGCIGWMCRLCEPRVDGPAVFGPTDATKCAKTKKTQLCSA